MYFAAKKALSFGRSNVGDIYLVKSKDVGSVPEVLARNALIDVAEGLADMSRLPFTLPRRWTMDATRPSDDLQKHNDAAQAVIQKEWRQNVIDELQNEMTLDEALVEAIEEPKARELLREKIEEEFVQKMKDG